MGAVQEDRPVYQSSTDLEWEGHPEKAIDGIYEAGLIKYSSCSLTQREVNPWWAVDLGKAYLLRGIVILPRLDCCCEFYKFSYHNTISKANIRDDSN